MSEWWHGVKDDKRMNTDIRINERKNTNKNGKIMKEIRELVYLYDAERLGAGLAGVTGQDLPMVEDALREGLASGVGAQVGGEAERLVDGQVRLHHEHGRAGHLRLLEHVPTTSVQHAVDTADGYLRALWNARLF